MSESVREVIERHHGFYGVAPYYVVVEEHVHGHTTNRRVHAGFEIDVYGVMDSPEIKPSDDYEQVYAVLEKTAAVVQKDIGNSCSIEVIPFRSTAFLDTSAHLRPEARFRIRISHDRGLDQPANTTEENALKEIQQQLNTLGIKQGRGVARR